MSSNSSNSSSNFGGEGNTSTSPAKQISPSIKWCFTLNNYDIVDEEVFSTIVPESCKYGIIGREIGEQGTRHLQGYLEFKQKKRPKSVFSNVKIHWEKAKGSRKQNVTYCSKDNDILLCHPKKRFVKTISPNLFYNWQKDIICTLKEEPDDRTIWWYWSKHGCVGKTTFCKYLVMKEECIVLGGKASDVRNGVIEYAKANDGETPDRIVINIPRSFASEYVSYEAFENLKDMLFYSGKYEGGMVCDNCPHLFIFANFKPELDKMSCDRRKIVNIDESTEIEDEFDFE